MFNVRKVGIFFGCALALHATPGITIQSDLSSAIDDGGYVVAQGPLAQSFTPTSAVTLTVVVVDLTNAPYNLVRTARPKMAGPSKAPVRTNGPSVTPYTVATLYADNAGAPGTSLAVSATQVADSQLTGTPQQFSFAFSFPLVANTRYWIGLSSPNNSVAFWSGSDFASGTDITTEFFEAFGFIVADSQFGSAFLIGVFGTNPVPGTPAPSTVWLTMIGLGCAALYLRRKSRGVLG